ncbi:MAG: response regulator [Candidatus Acidiferrales bacterium]
MMSAESIFESFFVKKGYALFEYIGDGSFRLIGSWPKWCQDIWDARPVSDESLRLGDSSPFLENFIFDAEEFWNSKSEGSLNSGNWIEKDSEGNATPLEASAYSLDGKRILLLNNLSDTFAQQQAWFQTARDSLLAHEKLHKEIQKKEILLHCIVHDLTQPLSAMTGVFHLLEREPLPSGLKKYVKNGERESQRQELMIRGILEAFSSDLAAQQSKESVSSSPPDLLACAKQAIKEFSTAFQQRSIRLGIDHHTDASLDWHVTGDAARIDRIFGNLLENAMRYAPADSAVTIGLEAHNGFVLAFVDDQGPGLPQGQIPAQLFALFSKGKEHAGKAGLGLYFCKITVDRWGGAIGAETRDQGGSRFWFRLPRAAHNAESQATASATDHAGHGKHSRGKGKTEPLRVLVADDAQINRELVIELLRKRGHQAKGVADGRQVLDALNRDAFDVLLLDEEMPGMTGLEATRAIRQRETATDDHQVIIGLSGHATEEDEHRFREAGMDACLSKPVQTDKLYQTVETAARTLRRPNAHQSPEQTQILSAMADSSLGSTLPEKSPAETSSESVDIAEHLRRTTGGNEKLMQLLAKTFLTDAPKTLVLIRSSIAKKNAPKLARASHLLKGSVAIFGAPKAVAAARKLEALGREGNLQETAAPLLILETEMALLQNQLKAIQSLPEAKTKARSKLRAKKARSR